jgi:hypothetical protein
MGWQLNHESVIFQQEINVKVKVRKKKYTPKVWREKRPAKVPKVKKTNGDKPRTAHHVQVGKQGAMIILRQKIHKNFSMRIHTRRFWKIRAA